MYSLKFLVRRLQIKYSIFLTKEILDIYKNFPISLLYYVVLYKSHESHELITISYFM